MQHKRTPIIEYKCPKCGNLTKYSKMKQVLRYPVVWLLFRDNKNGRYLAVQRDSYGADQLIAKFKTCNDRVFIHGNVLPEKWRGIPVERF